MNAQEFAPSEHWKSTLTTNRDTAANNSSAGANHAEAANSNEVLDSGAEEASREPGQNETRGPSPASVWFN